jgi:carboxylesterase
MKLKRPTLKKTLIYTPVIIIAIILIMLFATTGLLQASSIDKKDLQNWEYNGDQIKDVQEFSIIGTTETCWFLIHSYTATPEEMRPLAKAINADLKDFVFITQLSGHGSVPSALEGKNLELWYAEEQQKFSTLSSALCEEINVVGSSLSAPIALRLAQEKEVKNLFIINPFIGKPYQFYKILPYETRIKLFSDILIYYKKNKVAQINSPEGLQNHISYLRMPYSPIMESFDFIEETIANLSQITNPTLIAFGKDDKVSGDYSAITIHDGISSKKKALVRYDNSNHVLLMDNDRIAVMHDIITFDLQNQ